MDSFYSNLFRRETTLTNNSSRSFQVYVSGNTLGNMHDTRILAAEELSTKHCGGPMIDTHIGMHQNATLQEESQQLTLVLDHHILHQSKFRAGSEFFEILIFGEKINHHPKFSPMNRGEMILSIANQDINVVYQELISSKFEKHYSEKISALTRVINAYDPPTNEHSQRIIFLTEAIARKLGCSDSEIQSIRWATVLHDIGKLAVPLNILRKPGPLTRKEWQVIRQHPRIGSRIVSEMTQLHHVAFLILSHHEKFNGGGYPFGLKGEEIPLGARIISMVDAFSAMTEGRVYQPALHSSEAIEELVRCRGTHFDPAVVNALLELLDHHDLETPDPAYR